MPKVTIAIAIWNGAEYVERMLNSILAQTYQNLDILCVDDGSTDNSRDMLELMAQKDSRIRVVSQPNKGLPFARNRCLEEAHGEFVFVCDQDDCLHPQTIEFLVHIATRYNSDLVLFQGIAFQTKGMPSFDLVNDFDTIEREVCETRFEKLSAKSNVRVGLETWNAFAKTRLAKSVRFNNAISSLEGDHSIRLIAAAEKMVATKGLFYFYYTEAQGSMTHAKKVSVKFIRDFHCAIKTIFEWAVSTGFVEQKPSEWNAIRKYFIARNVKYQLNYIRRRMKTSDKQSVAEANKAFAEELRDLKRSGLLRFRDCAFRHYIMYLLVMKFH